MAEDDRGGRATHRVWFDEMSTAFQAETIERDGIVATVEAVIANADSPRDDYARYSLEVRARPADDRDHDGGEDTANSETEQHDGTQTETQDNDERK